MFDNKSTRHRHPQPPMNFIGLWVWPFRSREDWHLVKLRMSFKQLVFHIYLHRFNIIKIITFNNLPCFVQPKSSNASVFFFLVENPIEINTWFLSFHRMHYRSTSLSLSSPQTSLYQKKIPCHCYVITINQANRHWSYRLSVLCRSAVSFDLS